MIRIVVLAGGVGGAKLVDGLARLLSPDDLTIVVNTGDDFFHFGLKICPDLDTICYTLAGLANDSTGWGRKEETWRVIHAVEQIGGPAWFRLGDHDLATHLERTRLLADGQSLTQITRRFCEHWGVQHTILPMSDSPISTMVETREYGEIHFQEYFVKYQCQPIVLGIRFAGISEAEPSFPVVTAIKSADAIVFAPSNPWVSIDPIIKIPSVRNAINGKCVIAVSPIIEGRTIKGPAAKMFRDFGLEPSSLAVAEHYKDLLSGFVIDKKDEIFTENLLRWGIIPLSTNTIMTNKEDRQFLAGEVIKFTDQFVSR